MNEQFMNPEAVVTRLAQLGIRKGHNSIRRALNSGELVGRDLRERGSSLPRWFVSEGSLMDWLMRGAPATQVATNPPAKGAASALLPLVH